MQYKKQWKWYVYVIECLNDMYYTGMTWNISNRIEQHCQGQDAAFTRKYGVKKLKYVAEFDDFNEAREAERIMKDYSRKKKETLFNCNIDLIGNSPVIFRTK